MAVTFIYTRCPLPDFCPLMDRQFLRRPARSVGGPAIAGPSAPGLDHARPAYDTPPVLLAHARQLGADPKAWTSPPATAEDLDRFGSRFGVSVMRNDPSGAEVIHNLRTAVIDPRRPPHHDLRRKRLERCRPPEGVAACRRGTSEAPGPVRVHRRPSGARSIAAERRWRSSVPQRAALQPRAAARKARRCAASAASSGTARALPRGGARRRRHPRAARLAAAGPELRVDRRARPRDLRVQRAGRWGSVARSRDPGLHGRRAVFATPRALALSYVDPYVDLTGRVTAYAVVDLRVMGTYDWRLSSGTSGRSSGCCSTTRTAPSGAPTRASVVFARATGRSRRRSRISSPCTTSVANGGPHCRRSGRTWSGRCAGGDDLSKTCKTFTGGKEEGGSLLVFKIQEDPPSSLPPVNVLPVIAAAR